MSNSHNPALLCQLQVFPHRARLTSAPTTYCSIDDDDHDDYGDHDNDHDHDDHDDEDDFD